MTTKLFSDLADRRARTYAEVNGCTYQEALHRVLDDDPRLKAAYTGIETKAPQKASDATVSYVQQKRAGDEIHALVVEMMEQSEHLCSYAQALQHVLLTRPNLARRYSGTV